MHLSPSQLSLYLRCQVAWEFRYIQRVKSPLAGPLIRGIALDEACTAHYRGVALGHGLDAGEFVDAAVSCHETKLEEEDCKLDMPPDRSKEIVRKAAEGYYRDVATRLRPRSLEDVQRRYVVKLDGLDVIGIVDLITDRGIVVDTKLSSWQASNKAADSSLQLSTYAWLTGLHDLALAVAEPSTGKARLIWTTRDDADIARVQLLYSRAHAAILAGIAVPAEPGAWNCTPQWCGYWERCPFGGSNSGGR